MVFITFRAPSLKWEILRPLRSRGPDASPSGGPQTHYVRCVPPGRLTRPQSTVNSLPQFCEVRPRAHLVKVVRRQRRRNELRRVAARRVGWRRTARPKGSQEQCPSPANSSAQSTAQISAPCSARRGGKTDYGFPTRRTGTAQNPAQFSAPCPPHCGYAVAPPHSRRPQQFLPDWPSANRQNMPIHAGGRRIFCAPLFSFFARLARFILFRLIAEMIESLL